MRNITLVMAVVATAVLAPGARFAQAATSAGTPPAPAVSESARGSYVGAVEVWARRDTSAAGRSVVAAARYVKDEMSSAGRTVEIDTAEGLRAAASFSEKLADKVTTGTEEAWSTVSNTVHRAIAKVA